MDFELNCWISVDLWIKLSFSAKAQSYTAALKSLQSCPTLCDPIDGSPPGSPFLGFSRHEHWVGCHFLLQCMKVKVKVKSLSRVQLLVTPWTAAYQAPLSMEFARQECWSPVTWHNILPKSWLFDLTSRASEIESNVCTPEPQWGKYILFCCVFYFFPSSVEIQLTYNIVYV